MGEGSFGSLGSKFPREYGLGRARSSKLEESGVFGCCFLAEGRSHSLEQRTRERDLLSWRGASGMFIVGFSFASTGKFFLLLFLLILG